jgi:hypothetical protein
MDARHDRVRAIEGLDETRGLKPPGPFEAEVEASLA